MAAPSEAYSQQALSHAAQRWRCARQRAVAAESRLLEMAGPPPRRLVPLSDVAHVQRLHLEAARLLCAAVEEAPDRSAAMTLMSQVLDDFSDGQPRLDW